MSKQTFNRKDAETAVTLLDNGAAIMEIVAVNLDAAADEALSKVTREEATAELLRAQLNLLLPSTDHIAKCVGIEESDVLDALEIVLDKYLKDKVVQHQQAFSSGMILIDVLLNSEYSLKHEAAYINPGEVDSVILDSITGLDGEEIEFGVVGGKSFVPSFDSKEDGKYILHYFVKDIDDKTILKLTAAYDHNAKTVKAHGEGWERCAIRINLK